MRSKLAYMVLATPALVLLLASEAGAQERQRVTFPTSAETTKYTQQHLIEVGDVPGPNRPIGAALSFFASASGLFPDVRIPSSVLRVPRWEHRRATSLHKNAAKPR